MSEERKHAEKAARSEDLIHVAVVEHGKHTQVVGRYEGPKYRAIFPAEMCEHYHDTVDEAIVCGAPRVLAFTAIMHAIGKRMRETLADAGE